MLIHRHQRCIGLTLFRWGKRQCELWFVPKGEFIEPHSHPSMDGTVVFLYGRMLGDIGGKVGWVTGKDFLRCFNISAGVTHSAATSTFTMFLNIENWITRPSSAAIDFRRASESKSHSAECS